MRLFRRAAPKFINANMKLFTAAAARRLWLAALLSLLGLAPARGAVYLQFSTTNYYASETARVATITVLRVGGAVGLASVDYRTGDHPEDVEEGKDFYPPTARSSSATASPAGPSRCPCWTTSCMTRTNKSSSNW